MAEAAQPTGDGRDATVPLVAREGRACYLGERSAWHQDPWATSTALPLSRRKPSPDLPVAAPGRLLPGQPAQMDLKGGGEQLHPFL